ncbi:hypothetical protein KI809_10660 [Geobacter pelophilus]|uniref:Uncharacterized protein n=1 Tax=Geoanaerobacter pelophilus TaxID=60036 RepID=A0AAW4L8X2_9BACT|nr:hypothetical protein [Geoanaerobacter pelophilus]MBT0664761.1 hypothetical protein [Geoanaerobacter pelophilus]
MRWRIRVALVLLSPLLALWCFQAFPQARAWAAGIILSAPVEPGGAFPVAKGRNIRGAFMVVSSLGERDRIHDSLREPGMEVSINGTVWQLYSGITNDRWRQRPGGAGGGVTVHNNLTGRDVQGSHPATAISGIDTAIALKIPSRLPFDGRPGRDALRCEILNSGSDGVAYDENGLNPVGSPGPFTLVGYEGAVLLAESAYVKISYDWFVSIIDSQVIRPPAELDGMQMRRQVLDIGIQPSYSTHRVNNKVTGYLNVSTSRYPSGKRTCSATYYVPFTRRGAIGLPGQSGAATAAGARGAVQYNYSSGVMSGAYGLNYDPLTNTVTITGRLVVK